MDKKMMITVGLVCAGVGVLGVILPWATASMGPMSFSASGFDASYGTIVFLLCLVAGAGFLMQFLGKADAIPLKEKVYFFILCGAGALAALFTLLDFFDINTSDQVSRGIGIYLSLLGAIGVAAMGAMIALKARE